MMKVSYLDGQASLAPIPVSPSDWNSRSNFQIFTFSVFWTVTDLSFIDHWMLYIYGKLTIGCSSESYDQRDLEFLLS